MAEIASQGRVGEQGGGEAVVFDTSQFFQNVYNMQKDLYARQEKKKNEIKQQNATWNALLDDMPDVWNSDYEYVQKALNEYNDYVIDLKSQGMDPENLDPMVLKKLKELQNKVAKETSRAKDNEMYNNQAYQTLNNDKSNSYNKEHAANWLKEYGDPNKTPEERAKMRIESNPFKLNYDMIEFIDDTIPKEPEIKDTGRYKIKFRNKEAHKAIVFDYITNDPLGRDMYESLKKPNEDEKAFSERVAEEGQLRYPPQEDKQVAPGPKEDKSFKGGYGTGNWNDKLSISYSKDPSFANTDVNKLTITRTGTNDNLPFISVKDDQNNLIEFQPTSFYLTDQNKISVQGFKKDRQAKSVPAWVSYDLNKDVFKSQALGYDPAEEFRRLSGGTPTTSSTSGSQTKETPAQRAARIAAGG